MPTRIPRPAEICPQSEVPQNFKSIMKISCICTGHGDSTSLPSVHRLKRPSSPQETSPLPKLLLPCRIQSLWHAAKKRYLPKTVHDNVLLFSFESTSKALVRTNEGSVTMASPGNDELVYLLGLLPRIPLFPHSQIRLQRSGLLALKPQEAGEEH